MSASFASAADGCAQHTPLHLGGEVRALDEQRSMALAEQGEVEIAGRRYVTPQRLATLLSVSVRTLARWSARGIGPPKISIGKTILFDLAKVPGWLAAREVGAVRNPRR